MSRFSRPTAIHIVGNVACKILQRTLYVTETQGFVFQRSKSMLPRTFKYLRNWKCFGGSRLSLLAIVLPCSYWRALVPLIGRAGSSFTFRRRRPLVLLCLHFAFANKLVRDGRRGSLNAKSCAMGGPACSKAIVVVEEALGGRADGSAPESHVL